MTIRFWGAMLAGAAHLLLVVLVWFLFPFLMGGPAPEASAPGWWWRDLLLIIQFGAPHSLLLLPSIRQRAKLLLPGPLYGCFFTLWTCLSLLLLILAWQRDDLVFWQLEGWAVTAVHMAYCLSWVGLIYSLGLTGFGFQTGWTPFWAWVQGKEPPHWPFEVRGVYRWMRHPAYLSFMAQLWLTPVMTADRALLAMLMSGYILVGSYLKDRRLVFYLGDTYRQYQAEVPGYLIFGLGPLGRVAKQHAQPTTTSRA